MSFDCRTKVIESKTLNAYWKRRKRKKGSDLHVSAHGCNHQCGVVLLSGSCVQVGTCPHAYPSRKYRVSVVFTRVSAMCTRISAADAQRMRRAHAPERHGNESENETNIKDTCVCVRERGQERQTSSEEESDEAEAAAGAAPRQRRLSAVISQLLPLICQTQTI
eukprot:375847-Rhodomonas_salina.1